MRGRQSLEGLRVEAEPAERMVEGVWKEHIIHYAKCQLSVATPVGGWRHWP